MDRQQRKHYFEGLYREREEPWDYSRLAAEVMRHDLVIRTARDLPLPARPRVLDVGCSLGQLTARLPALTPHVHAIDISQSAARQAEARCRATPGAEAFRFYVGSATELPFDEEAFDLVLLCDGIFSWQLPGPEQEAVLREAHRVTVRGGFVILTDALKPRQIEHFEERVRSSPFEAGPLRRLNDRLWYSMERGVRPIQGWGITRAALRSKAVAHLLTPLSRLAGKRGTKHVCMVGRKTSGEAR